MFHPHSTHKGIAYLGIVFYFLLLLQIAVPTWDLPKGSSAAIDYPARHLQSRGTQSTQPAAQPEQVSPL